MTQALTVKAYEVRLVPGCRPGGLPQFGSQAEQLHNQLAREELKRKYIVDSDISALGGLIMRLTKAQAIEVEANPLVLDIQPLVIPAPAALQEDALWALAMLCEDDLDRFIYTRTGKGVTIYIVDTGIGANLHELTGRQIEGYNPVEGEETIFSHGSSVAACAAGSLYGVAKEATVVNIRATDNISDVLIHALDGLNWIITNHAEIAPGRGVINASWGSSSFSSLQEDAFNTLAGMDIICVAAAGNDTTDTGQYPASFTPVINVGSITKDRELSDFSNFGPSLDILAPGSYIDTIDRKGTKVSVSGTSVACPYVTGTIASLLGAQPDLTRAQILTILQDYCSVNPATLTDENTTDKIVRANVPLVGFGLEQALSKIYLHPGRRVKYYTPPDKTYLNPSYSIVKVGSFSLSLQKIIPKTQLFGLQGERIRMFPEDNPIAE